MNKLSKCEELTINAIVKYTKEIRDTELSITGHGGKRERAGRPLILSTPLPTKAIRCTDEEYQLLKEYLKTLRSGKNEIK